MADTEEITRNLLEMYGHDDWIMRGNFRIFLELSGIASLPRSAAILDLGCAMGHFMRLLQNQGFSHVTGVDAAPAMVDIARKITGCTIHLSDATLCDQLLTPGSQDVIVISDLIHHLEKVSEWERLLMGCHRLLKPGGILVIREPWPTLIVRLLQFFSQFPVLYRGAMAARLRSFQEEKNLLEHFYTHWITDYPQHIARAGFAKGRDLVWLVHRITVCVRRESTP
ncbi:MAG: class I SAM-dependent methyltransferase [Magnetococcales bacterium]|nr:class I SAM-dependent methyltransferase [Magnetococcales bacterium]